MEPLRSLRGTPGTNRIKRIKIVSAVEAAAQAIRDAIIEGELNPGERLVERHICASLGLGYPTLRQALMELEHQGLIRKIPRRGSYVSEYTADDYKKMSQVRIVLEALALERAAPKLTTEVESELRITVTQMEAAAEDGDAAAFTDWDVAFHSKAWSLAGNKYLVDALERVTFQLFVFATSERRMSRESLQDSARSHKAILEVLCSRDPVAARRVFVSRATQFWDNFLDAHKREASARPAA